MFKNYITNPKLHLPYEIEESPELKIQIQHKPFSEEFIEYFSSYGLDENDCKNENIYCVDKLYYNGNRAPLGTTLCIAYYFPEIDKLKILRPYLPKKDKWRSNVPNTYIDGLSDITDEIDYIIIVKSKKDKALIKKLGFKNVVSIQMEGKAVITAESEERMKNKRKIIWLDNDSTGKEVSAYYAEKGYIPILFDDFYYEKWGITDPTDYRKEFQETSKIIELLNERINEKK